MNYANIGIIALLVHLIINCNVLKKNKSENFSEPHVLYRIFLFSVTIYYIFDISWGFVYGLRFPMLAFIWTELYFISVAITVFLWTRYVISYINKSGLFTAFLKYAGIIFLAFELISIALNLFFPIMFRFDENGEYHTEKARTATMLAQIFLFLSTSLYMFSVVLRTHGKMKKRHRTIGWFGISMTVFVILAAIYSVLPFYSLGYLLGTCFIHTFVLEDEKEEKRQELERLLQVEEIQEIELGSARLLAYTDPLTGVKSKGAYQEDVLGIEKRIEDKILKDFGIVVFDVNNLKITNDTKGHDEGDKLIKEACKIICRSFEHSPVYRIGGDEFTVFLMGEDFKNQEQLLKRFNAEIGKNKENGGPVISCGFASFSETNEKTYKALFELADSRMYERKHQLKEL